MSGDPLEHDGGADLSTSPEVDIDTALREWDAANPDPPVGQQQPAHGDQDRLGRETAEPDEGPHHVPYPLDYGPVREALQAQEARIIQERGRQDFERLLDKLEREPSFTAMGREFLGTFLVGLAQADDRVARDWSRRNENPRQWAQRYSKVVANLAETLRRRPDQEATDTRAAVTAAIRGGGRATPEPAAKNWGSMTNKEFSDATKEFGMGGIRDW